jgi:hypothetical protein
LSATSKRRSAPQLQSRGDPRGELIALQHAGKQAAARRLFERHLEHFLGELAKLRRLSIQLGNAMDFRVGRAADPRRRGKLAKVEARDDPWRRDGHGMQRDDDGPAEDRTIAAYE